MLTVQRFSVCEYEQFVSLSLFLNLSEKHYSTDKNENKMMTENRRVYTRSRWEWETNRRTLDMVFEKWTAFH
jgi:hypothetical protein